MVNFYLHRYWLCFWTGYFVLAQCFYEVGQRHSGGVGPLLPVEDTQSCAGTGGSRQERSDQQLRLPVEPSQTNASIHTPTSRFYNMPVQPAAATPPVFVDIFFFASVIWSNECSTSPPSGEQTILCQWRAWYIFSVRQSVKQCFIFCVQVQLV